MKKTIRNYKDLLQEEQRLEQLREVQSDIISLDYHQWKEQLAPVKSVFGMVNKLARPASNNSFLSLPIQMMLQKITRWLMPKKSGLLRWLVPILVRNYSSGKVNKWADQLLHSVQSWQKNKKKKKHRETEEGDKLKVLIPQG